MIRLIPPMALRKGSLLSFSAIAILAHIGSGRSGSSPPSVLAGNLEGASGANAPTDSTPPIDESLAGDEYLRLGLPAYDRAWNHDDMAQAEFILAAVAQKGVAQLPRYRSKRSGEVFLRLISKQNLESYDDAALPPAIRLRQALSHFGASNQIAKIYLRSFPKKDGRDTELAELLGSHLEMTVVILQLLDECLPTIAKNDPQYEKRIQELDQIRLGFEAVVFYHLRITTQTESYRLTERMRLVDYMKDTFPLIIPKLSSDASAECLRRLEDMQDDPVLQDLQPGLGELQLRVKGTVERPEAP